MMELFWQILKIAVSAAIVVAIILLLARRRSRRWLARGVAMLLTRGKRSRGGEFVDDLIQEHFHPVPINRVTIVEREFPYRVRADLQQAIDEIVAQSGAVRHHCAVRQEQAYEGLSLAGLLSDHIAPAVAVPLQYEEIDVGNAQPVRCLKSGLWLLDGVHGKFAVLMTAAERFGRTFGMKVEIAAPADDADRRRTEQFFQRLETAVAAARSYRGKILSLESGDHYSGAAVGVKVHKLRRVAREQVILPEKALKLLDRNVIDFARRRPGLAQCGFAVKKGVLFYGPPGTGKTFTIHYLAGALTGHTTLLIASEQVGLLDEYMTLARLLQPSMVVIEDADLIARSRENMNSVCEEVLLNKLLNEMDGLREDAEILFILTTNRPESLEAALASRPGRIDQAIEFPLPDEIGRAKLVRLYAGGMEVSDELVELIVRRTQNVSAAFIKELMRRSMQFRLERNGEGGLQPSDLEGALEELLFAGGSLNLKLLGAESSITAAGE